MNKTQIEFCDVSTSNGTRCFSNGTEANGCKDYCKMKIPPVIRWIKEYFDIKTDESEYCLFVKYIFMTSDFKINTSSITKDVFDYYMKIFIELKRLERDLNTINEKIKLENKNNQDVNTPLLNQNQNIKFQIENKIKISLNGIPNESSGFLDLRNILFTQYDEYLSDILYTFKESCSIVSCTKAFIDMLIWQTNDIDGLKELITFKTKEEVLSVVEAKLKPKIIPVYIKSDYYYWFLDTIISNSSDVEIIKLAIKYKHKTYDELVENFRENGILYDEFIRIITSKLNNIRFALQKNLCTSKFNKKDYRTKLYSDVNPFVEEYYSNV